MEIANLHELFLAQAKLDETIAKNHNVDLKGNNDVLSLTRPDVIKQVHADYLEAGADIIECNTFGANKISQKEYNTTPYIKDMNRVSVKIAKEVAKEYSTLQKPRFVAGTFGPTSKTASISPDVENPQMRDVTFDELVEAYEEQGEQRKADIIRKRADGSYKNQSKVVLDNV